MPRSSLKKALSLFVEIDGDAEEETPISATSFRMSSSQSTTSLPTAQSTAVQPMDPSMFETYFDELFDKANLPGPDYFELREAMETLEEHIPDEKARISAAFAMLKKQGLTKANLIDTAKQYVAIVKKDATEFGVLADTKAKTDIEQSISAAQKAEKELQSVSEQIRQLQEKEIALKQEATTQRTKAAEVEAKISNRKAGYAAASAAMLTMINDDIHKFTTTIANE